MRKVVKLRAAERIQTGDLVTYQNGAGRASSVQRAAHPADTVAGMAMSTVEQGGLVDVVLDTEPNDRPFTTSAEPAPGPDLDAWAPDLWKRALAPTAPQEQQHIVSDAVAAYSAGKLSRVEVEGLLSRFGFSLSGLMLEAGFADKSGIIKPPESVTGIRWANGELLIVTSLRQTRLTRDLDLYRRGGHSTPARVFAEGGGKQAFQEAEDAIDALESIL